MRATTAAMALAILCAGGPATAQSGPGATTIHNLVLDAAAGVLSISGAGFGEAPVVTVDGLAVTVLPGSTDTRVDVVAPAVLLTTAGTYRVTVTDAARRSGDAMGIAVSGGSMTADLAGAVFTGGTMPPGSIAPPASRASQVATASSGGSSGPNGPGAQALIEDTASPFRTAIGHVALGNNQASGVYNTAAGFAAMADNTTGRLNTAAGAFALWSNTTGRQNTALGVDALRTNTTGFDNLALGVSALENNDVGFENIAVGNFALSGLTSGLSNVAVGYNAGNDITSGSNNIVLGSNVFGASTDDNTMRLGLPFNATLGIGQNQTFIAGIRGSTVAGELVTIDANHRLGSSALAPPNSIGSAQVTDLSLSAVDLADDAVTASKVAFNYAASTSEGGAAVDVNCAGCVSATEVGFAFASLGANTFAGTQTLATGNLDLSPSTATSGVVMKQGFSFLHNAGTQNTFLGVSAGNLTLTGAQNTATGFRALAQATTGARNTAGGYVALFDATTGSDNTALGHGALADVTTGNANTALGVNAGASAVAGDANIFIGAGVTGTAADTHTIRIGLPFAGATGQNQTYIAGIYGSALTSPAHAVFVDANGRLGTVTPPVLTGSISSGVTMTALERRVLDQERQARAQEAVVAELLARVKHLETLLATSRPRR